MANRYAVDTTVSVSGSREEIQRTLKKYGASSFAYQEDDAANRAVVGFERNGIRYRFLLRYAPITDFNKTSTGKPRTNSARETIWEQDKKARWRALAALIKATLIAIDLNIMTFEEAFMQDIIMPDGQTFKEWAAPQMEKILKSGEMPPMLPRG